MVALERKKSLWNVNSPYEWARSRLEPDFSARYPPLVPTNFSAHTIGNRIEATITWTTSIVTERIIY